jgi:hypothetical protein
LVGRRGRIRQLDDYRRGGADYQGDDSRGQQESPEAVQKHVVPFTRGYWILIALGQAGIQVRPGFSARLAQARRCGVPIIHLCWSELWTRFSARAPSQLVDDAEQHIMVSDRVSAPC